MTGCLWRQSLPLPVLRRCLSQCRLGLFSARRGQSLAVGAAYPAHHRRTMRHLSSLCQAALHISYLGDLRSPCF